MNLYLINGFLGSGKTTAIASACKQLVNKNIKAAVITNDQGKQQVDSAYIKGLSFLNREVANGCFCCRYDELEQIISILDTGEHPEIIFAESVGSCTDLVATVVKPFALNNQDARTVISVFADAYLMHSIMKGTSCFIEDSVQYIYRKQLEEADIIVINKKDLLEEKELQYVKEIMETSYQGKTIICLNACDENDIHSWLSALDEFIIPPHRNSLEVDYDLYATGEAMLAWFDQKISLHTPKPNAVAIASVFAETVYNNTRKAGLTIGHLKFLLSDGTWSKKISYTINGLKENYVDAELHSCSHLDVLINARVQTSPQSLQHIISETIEETMTRTRCRIIIHQSAAFQPGYPRPAHRITS